MSETKVKKKNQDYVSLKALVMMQLKNKIIYIEITAIH